MGRRIFNICTALSLLASLVMVGMCIRSFFTIDYVEFSKTPQRSYVLFSKGGSIELVRADEPFNPTTGGYTTVGSYDSPLLPVDLPYALAVLPFAVLPYIWLLPKLNALDSNRLGLCARCGYDLRASKERCPECGTPIPLRCRDNDRIG